MLLNHIAIICSSEENIRFYGRLGFKIQSKEDRGYDKLFYMRDGLTTLEIYIDPNHPKDAVLLMLIKDHYFGLKEALKAKDNVTANGNPSGIATTIIDTHNIIIFNTSSEISVLGSVKTLFAFSKISLLVYFK